MTVLPANLAQTFVDIHGERGRAWFAGLPAHLDRWQRRWSITVQPPFPDLSYNYVAPARRANGTPIVLKASPPNPQLALEAAALRHYDGRAMVRLLDEDQQEGVILLERILPGRPLVYDLQDLRGLPGPLRSNLLARDEAATRVAAGVMRQLWRPLPPNHPFPTLADWATALRDHRQQYDGGTGPLPADLFATAETLFADLLASSDSAVLLHGDLHHWNILTATRQPWLALDPHGVAGEPAFEVGPLLHNPIGHLLSWPNPGRILARRLDLLAETLGFDRARLAAWGVAFGVLSAVWSAEDHGEGWQEAIEVAQTILDLGL